MIFHGSRHIGNDRVSFAISTKLKAGNITGWYPLKVKLEIKTRIYGKAIAGALIRANGEFTKSEVSLSLVSK